MEWWFELWDAQNASLVGTYDTEEAALAVVQRSLSSFGAHSIQSLVLTAEDAGDADSGVVAAGADLAVLAARRSVPLVG